MIAANISKVRSDLQRISPNRAVKLVAVSKTKPCDAIMDAYSCGQRHFGENYVSELVEKYQRLPAEIQWHFIGHLQSNKVSKLIRSCPNLYMIETVDSQRLANKINTSLSTVEKNTRLKVLVEVLTSGEGTKSGAQTSEVLPLVRYIIDACANLEFDGLMTIADPSNPEASFQALAEIRSRLEAESIHVNTLSMGMSGDYVKALEYGSNEVRIGSIIFGSR